MYTFSPVDGSLGAHTHTHTHTEEVKHKVSI